MGVVILPWSVVMIPARDFVLLSVFSKLNCNAAISKVTSPSVPLQMEREDVEMEAEIAAQIKCVLRTPSLFGEGLGMRLINYFYHYGF